MPDQNYLLIKEVAEKLRVSMRTIENLLKDDKINFPKPKPLTKKRLWIESEIDEYMSTLGD